jgi:hypothetical protein
MEHNIPGTTETVVVVVPFISGEAQSEFLEGELVFNPSDPYAVSMNLEARSGTVTWTFARELLEQGIYSPSGDGDVQVWPAGQDTDRTLHIALSSPFGNALFEVPRSVLVRFLRRTYVVVPRGRESDHLDVDAAVNRLLAGR